MSSLVLTGDTSGQVTLAAPAVAGTNTITLAAQTGTLNVAGPAFSAYQSSAQSLSANTATKISLQTKEFDTNSNFDNVTNYRFTPTVAGYYQLNASIRFSTTSTTAVVSIYKNGVSYKFGTYVTNGAGASVSALVYLNGTTDYVEAYGTIGSTQNLTATLDATYFQGVLVRGG